MVFCYFVFVVYINIYFLLFLEMEIAKQKIKAETEDIVSIENEVLILNFLFDALRTMIQQYRYAHFTLEFLY